jgi:DNA invertase Pin-like site-specific DNA recombinase
MTTRNQARYAGLPLVAYTRVSTTGQAESGLGLDAQRTAIREAAARQGFEVGAWHEDAGRSGAKMANRPGLSAAIAAVEARRAGGIVAAKLDRLGRSSAEVLGLVERGQREGWRLVILDVGCDTSSPAGELVAAALAMAARFELRRITERNLDAANANRRKGEPRNGFAAVPRETADRIIALRGSGATYRAIAGLLEGESIPTARGGKQWEPATVRSAEITRRRELDAQSAA